MGISIKHFSPAINFEDVNFSEEKIILNLYPIVNLLAKENENNRLKFKSVLKVEWSTNNDFNSATVNSVSFDYSDNDYLLESVNLIEINPSES